MPRSAINPWTQADVNTLVKLYREGQTIGTIAAKLGRKEYSCHHMAGILKKEGILKGRKADRLWSLDAIPAEKE